MTQVVESGFSRRRLDRYELIAEIASGGMGVVLLGRIAGAGGFERLFAIKMMHPHLMEEPQFVAMLLDEARVAAKIHHPNVVAMVDVCSTGSNYCLVMDYVNGFPLLEILDSPLISGQKRVRVVLRVLVDVMAGLEAAHNLRGDDGLPLGIVHRDVSPQNVLVGIDGVARLTDFGIALAASRISASRPGMIKGKPGYMAPEQARAYKVDRRADLWALGVILWEAVAGRRLFVADTEAAIVLKVIEEAIPPLREVAPDTPPELEAIVSRALERDPAARYASAREMAADVERVAIPRGLLADSHEVSDLIRQTFAAEIDQRRKSIRRHINAIGPNSGPITLREAYELPNLRDDAVLASTSPQSPAAGVPTSPLLLSTPARRSISGEQLVPRSTTGGGAAADLPPSRKKHGAAIAVALSLVLLSGSAVAYKLGWLGAGASEASGGDKVESERPAPAARPDSDANKSPAGTAAAVAPGPVVSPEPAPSESAAPAASTGARPRAGTRRAAPPAARPVATPPARSAGTAPSPRESPTIEENPYRLR